MSPQDMVIILEKYGFTGLKLQKHEERTATFKYADFKESTLKKTLGAPTVTSNKKVMIFAIPEIGRIGISPTNNMVRFISEHEVKKAETSTLHLGKTEIPDAYITALEKAKVSPALRIKWMTKMWEWFNEHKFGGRLPKPKLLTGPRPPGVSQHTRGFHQGGIGFGPGKIWLAPYLFNARPVFILEIFLHEMCHQAVWNIDKHNDDSGTQGHGPNWQRWMTKVGLDPRRFDPTDEVEYLSTQDAKVAEADLTRRYGPRVPDSHFAGMRKLPQGHIGDAIVHYKGRAIEGYMRDRKHGVWPFTFRTPSGDLNVLGFPTWPAIYAKD